MSNRFGFVQACIVGAVLGGTALVSTDAFAQCCQGGSATAANIWTDGLATSASWPADPWLWPADNASLLKAPPVAPFWWTHGEIEVGGRDFLNSPTVGGSIWGDNVPGSTLAGGYGYLGQQSLAKYYEYSIVAPGAFGGGHIATGTSDGLYQIDLWANNVGSNFAGFSDQAYQLTASKAGEQYFTFIWDQTPHIYSTSAQTFFGGVGSNALTLPAGLMTTPVSATNASQNIVPFGHTVLAGGILPYLYPIDVGIQRNTAAVDYRVTDPWYAWNAEANYSYMTRTGTQPAGVIGLQGGQPTSATATASEFAATQVPAPVNDSTQNFGAKGEYIGTSLWGQKFTFKAAYNGSIYTDNISSYTVQNPFAPFPSPTPNTCIAATTTAPGSANCGSAQMSTPPSNQANGFSETTSADLPWNSRYVGTTNVTAMTQNSAFQPMTNNPLATASPFGGGANWNTIGALPATSLHGDINTILSNNVITTKITPELTSKLQYRYYDFDNQTPQIVFPCWVSYDGTGVAPTSLAHPCSTSTALEGSISSLSISYVKQDAGAELNWRPTKEWNVNAAYGYERYDYTQADAGATNENSAKLAVDWKPFGWLTARASGSYANRTEEDYNYYLNVASIQFPTVGNFPASGNGWYYSPAYQQFMFDNRQRTKADVLLDVVVLPGVTVTPTFKYKDDYYGLNPVTQDGLSDQKSISAGVDVAWVVTPTLSITASYYWESYNQQLYSNTGIPHTGGYTGPPPPPASAYGPQVYTTDLELVNTFTAAIKWAAIPNSLNFDARYTGSFGVDEQTCSLCTGTIGTPTGGTIPAGTPFPNNNTYFQRVDVTGTYRFDPTWVQQMGFKGDVLFRLRYTWENNTVTNWQNDALAPFTDISGMVNSIWMAYDNPNYNVHMLSASLIARW